MKKLDRGSTGRKISQRMGELTLARIAEDGLRNAKRNQPRIAEGHSILKLAETGLGDSDAALVIAAGPSIHRHDTAEMIKESGFSGTVIATESSMAWCLRNGITPDLVVTVDPHPDRIVRWFGDPSLDAETAAQDDYFARQEMDPKFAEDQIRHNADLVDLVNANGPSMSIAIASSAADAVARRASESKMTCYWWNPFYDDYDLPGSRTRKLHEANGLPCINAGGNVGTACWVIAHAILGKTKIGLLGVDFGYYGDTTYRQTQYYTEIVELFGEENLEKIFVHIDNPHTKSEFFTDPAYLWYRDIFLEMSAATGGVTTYNCTGGGILFGEGIEFVDFATFVAASL